MSKTIIIIPTYNERENIGLLIEELQLQFEQIPHDCHILVVDDNSPDGTAEIVHEKQVIYPNIHLLPGQKQGLGAAYIRGMRYAVYDLEADAVFEMDADFSHKPEDVPRLMKALDEGADFVIGSRYVKGGSIPKKWGFFRRINSLYGNILARYIAGIYKVRDCTAGFRAIKALLLRDIDLGGLRVQGYAFQVALLYEAKLRGAKIKEIPVDFIERTEGYSKLGLADIMEFISNVWWIRFRSSKTLIKFGIVGLSGAVVNIGTFTLLLFADINKYLASPLAIEFSIITNFICNNYWTFRWRKTNDGVKIKALKFNIVSFIALGISYSTFVLLSFIYPAVEPQIHQLIGIIPAMLVNYFLNSYWTFKHVSKLDV